MAPSPCVTRHPAPLPPPHSHFFLFVRFSPRAAAAADAAALMLMSSSFPPPSPLAASRRGQQPEEEDLRWLLRVPPAFVANLYAFKKKPAPLFIGFLKIARGEKFPRLGGNPIDSSVLRKFRDIFLGRGGNPNGLANLQREALRKGS